MTKEDFCGANKENYSRKNRCKFANVMRNAQEVF